MARVFLGLGANLGDARANIEKALSLLESRMHIGAVSSWYDTAPVGYLDQPRFLNLVCEGTTDLAPAELLTFVKGIEQQLGRQPTVRYGPRPVDIDILLYDDKVIRAPDLEIPHPRLAERGFVLLPLAEIAAAVIVPGTGKTVDELRRALPEQDVKRLGQD
ncbi:MAG: 2-amino-4-hydroxy-6-hydroxymethyldihydropteridine diphosphokinase [Dehalococcoidales bacterium]|nr:2-amino-4-hydroxy-6-hydroxymethyldihydropteridine diphosphokinase [Dehalococcoidales bacterium]